MSDGANMAPGRSLSGFRSRLFVVFALAIHVSMSLALILASIIFL